MNKNNLAVNINAHIKGMDEVEYTADEIIDTVQKLKTLANKMIELCDVIQIVVEQG